jgi:hypothetical protein
MAMSNADGKRGKVEIFAVCRLDEAKAVVSRAARWESLQRRRERDLYVCLPAECRPHSTCGHLRSFVSAMNVRG